MCLQANIKQEVSLHTCFFLFLLAEVTMSGQC